MQATPSPPGEAVAPASPPVEIRRLTQRSQFLRVAQGISAARGAVVVQARPREDRSPSLHVGVGFTATKKVGGAVVRNRAKRRLRETARALLPSLACGGFDYVFVARAGAPKREWTRLLDDVKSALISVAAGGDPPRARSAGGRTRSRNGPSRPPPSPA